MPGKERKNLFMYLRYEYFTKKGERKRKKERK